MRRKLETASRIKTDSIITEPKGILTVTETNINLRFFNLKLFARSLISFYYLVAQAHQVIGMVSLFYT